jgi:hypothetical protein
MKTIAEYTVKIPDYALPYLINGDKSGLAEQDIKSIDSYMDKEFYGVAREQNASVIISPSEEESYFTWRPAFGLACNVVDCTILLVE